MTRPADLDQRPIAELIPYARNSRTHSDAQVAQIAASIREFGFTNPVLIDGDGGIIAGHGRVLAARKLKMAAVPVLVLDHLTDAQRRAYVIADNKLALNAGWDDEALRVEIEALTADGFDLSLTGFDQAELDALLAPEPTQGLTDPDETPEPPADPVTVLGDVWLLGSHRIVCGDCTNPNVLKSATNGKEAHICATDPPYGVNFKYNSHNDTEGALKAIVDDFFPLVRSMCRTILITPGNQNQWLYPRPDWTLCWFSSAGVGSGPWGFCCWQPVLAYGKDPYLKMGRGRRPDAFASNEGKPKNIAHACPKPVEVWRWIMDRADPSECATFLDPFGGSGTTMIVAQMTGRVAFLVELDPAYVDVAVTRWQDFTGQTATLEGDGRTFEQIKAERHGAKA